jgi:hypothetical protein
MIFKINKIYFYVFYFKMIKTYLKNIYFIHNDSRFLIRFYVSQNHHDFEIDCPVK